MESCRNRIFHKVLIFVLFSSGTVLAQFRTANLSGTVADEAGIPLEGVGIKVTFLTPSRDFVGPTLVREVWSGLTEVDGNNRVIKGDTIKGDTLVIPKMVLVNQGLEGGLVRNCHAGT